METVPGTICAFRMESAWELSFSLGRRYERNMIYVLSVLKETSKIKNICTPGGDGANKPEADLDFQIDASADPAGLGRRSIVGTAFEYPGDL